MAQNCKDTCENHSGNMVRIEQLEKRADRNELELEKYKSYCEGKMDKFSSDMRELSKEFTKKLDDSVKEIKIIIDSKETNKDNKAWILIGMIGSPIVVILLQKLSDILIG